MKIKVFVIVFTISVISTSCLFNNSLETSSSANYTPTFIPTIMPEATPDYIYMLWPEPSSIELKSNYENFSWYDNKQPSICAEFETIALLEKGDFLSYEQLSKRFSLQVDGKIINQPSYTFTHDTEGFDLVDPKTKEPLYHSPAGSPHFICFAVELSEGLHSATLVARKTSGDTLTYSWSFVLVDGTPTPTFTPYQ